MTIHPVVSDSVAKALEGVTSIQDFLTDPKYKRRRETSLTLASACTIERANCDLRIDRVILAGFGTSNHR